MEYILKDGRRYNIRDDAEYRIVDSNVLLEKLRVINGWIEGIKNNIGNANMYEIIGCMLARNNIRLLEGGNALLDAEIEKMISLRKESIEEFQRDVPASKELFEAVRAGLTVASIEEMEFICKAESVPFFINNTRIRGFDGDITMSIDEQSSRAIKEFEHDNVGEVKFLAEIYEDKVSVSVKEYIYDLVKWTIDQSIDSIKKSTSITPIKKSDYMEYVSSNEFISKLNTDNYMLGSFDVYLDEANELIKKHPTDLAGILEKMPTSLRASIVRKKDNKYLGFISAVDLDYENSCTSLELVLKDYLDEEKTKEIVDAYTEFLYNDLGITSIKNFSELKGSMGTEECHEVFSAEVLLTSEYLGEGIKEKEKDKLIEEGYNIPNLQMPCTIMDGYTPVGLIGLTNLIWSNRRADLQVFVDKDRDESYIRDVIPEVINDYLDYVHERNLYNVSMSISGSDTNMMKTVLDSEMNFYASIPYASSYKGNSENKYLFQSYPEMEKVNGLYIPENKIITNPKEITKDFTSVIDLGNGYVAIRPSVFEEKGININKIVKSHINAMQDRNKFTIPLGEDKYMIQEGNGKYGISKAVNNYSYIILDEDMNYVGFTNILRDNSLNAEIEMALDPKYQSRGIGSSMRKKFYEELFRKGYMSVTSAVFDFNDKSNGLNEKFAKFSGTRIGAYYINGKLHDMNYYTREKEDTGYCK